MTAFYKHFMIRYEQQGSKILVTSIIAHGNFQCMYGTRIYDSLDALKRDLDNKVFG